MIIFVHTINAHTINVHTIKLKKEVIITLNYFEDCLYFSANLLARRLNTIADEAFEGMDITATQGFTLIAIGELDKHTPSEIAAELEMNPSTITRFLDKLEKIGYVKREYYGRKTQVDITSNGEEKLKEIFKCWDKIHNKNAQIFGDEAAQEVTQKIKQINKTYVDKNNQ